MPILLRTPTTNVAACITLANTAGFVAFYRASHATGKVNASFQGIWEVFDRPLCHGYHGLYLWRKFCHMQKFQISVKNLNNLWRFIEIYAVFVLNLCGEKSVWRKSLWRKTDKYEVCSLPLIIQFV